MSDKPINPPGYNTVSPYLIVENPHKLLAFLAKVFDAEIMEQLKDEDGNLTHGEARIGDSVIMVGKSREGNEPTNSMVHVHVADAQETYQRAMKEGHISIMEPTDQFYGHRAGGFKGPQGNSWWVSQVLEVLSEEEIQKRMDSQ